MPQSDKYEVRLKYFMADLTEQHFDGQLDVPTLATYHDIPIGEASAYAHLVGRIDHTLIDVAPPAQFKKQLRADLVGDEPSGMFTRLRKLPPRLQVAAIIALLAAMALLGRRRFFGEAQKLLAQVRSMEMPPITSDAKASLR